MGHRNSAVDEASCDHKFENCSTE